MIDRSNPALALGFGSYVAGWRLEESFSGSDGDGNIMPMPVGVASGSCQWECQ